MQVKIYDHTLTPLTTLFQNEVESLSYSNSLYNGGSAGFTVRADNTKVKTATIRQYNRVKIFEGTTCVFFGFINECQHSLNTVDISVIHISEILKNRTTGGSFAATGTMDVVLTSLLAQVNSVANTGISLGGVTNISGVYSKTYNSGETVTEILDDLLGIYQYYINNEGKLYASTLLGNNLSSSVQFRYDINQVQSANLTTFKVTESSQSLLTKITAFNDYSLPVQIVQDTSLISTYGIVEAVKKYYNVYSNGEITDKANADLKPAGYTPEVVLYPDTKDNFQVTDIVKIRLNNGLIDITDDYQVIEKSVTLIGEQKKITVKLNDRQKSLVDFILDQRKRIKLLENN